MNLGEVETEAMCIFSDVYHGFVLYNCVHSKKAQVACDESEYLKHYL